MSRQLYCPKLINKDEIFRRKNHGLLKNIKFLYFKLVELKYSRAMERKKEREREKHVYICMLYFIKS